MPGSKTYTSNKVNELLELELFDTFHDLEKNRFKVFSRTIFFEIIKICISLLFSSLIEYETTCCKNTENSSIIEINTITQYIIVFTLAYIAINILAVISKWLLDAIFNIRLFPSEKEKAHINFHKRIVNHMYLAISFENKYNVYISQASNQNNDLNLDLAANYLSQSVHYFLIAKSELKKLIPPLIKKRSAKKKRSADFLNHVGYPLLNVSLVSAQRSLNRLLATKEQTTNIVDSIDAKSNEEVIKLALSKSIINLYSEVESYITEFESLLETLIDYQKYYENNTP